MVLWSIAALFIAAIDQLTKYLVAENLELGKTINIIPHILDFTYVKNTGAAFSMLENSTWVLSIISVIFCVAAVLYMIIKKPKNKVLRFSLLLIFAGALGNAIDRLFLGYVIDFLDLAFMEFPVFNVADVSITVGAFILIAGEVFFGLEEKKNG